MSFKENRHQLFPGNAQKQMKEIDRQLNEIEIRLKEYDNFKYHNTSLPEIHYLRMSLEQLRLMRRFIIVRHTGNLEDHQRILFQTFDSLFKLSSDNDKLFTELYELKNKFLGQMG